MNFLKQYFKVINYALMGLVFGFACFYILINAYHYLEIRKDLVTDFDSQNLVISYNERINNINRNISTFNANTYSGNIATNQMQVIQGNLSACSNSLNNETYQSMKGKDRITIIDVYNLQRAYEDNVMNECVVNNLYWLATISNDNFASTYMNNNKELMKLYINTLLNETSYVSKDLINNSSYYFNTSIATASVKHNTKDGFYEVLGAYSKAADFVEFVSEWFRNEVEGNYD